MDTENAEQYVDVVLALSIMVGVMQLCMGIFRLGVITSFLADPVLSGFTNAAAVLVSTSQLKHLVGMVCLSPLVVQMTSSLKLVACPGYSCVWRVSKVLVCGGALQAN